jgi:4-amino-4-deoxychorismate lyase
MWPVDKWLVNGEPASGLPLDDRGLQYGDGLFETIAVRDGNARLLDRHLERLGNGCRRLGIPAPDMEQLIQETESLLANAGSGTLKIIVTRGAGRRGYAPPPDATPTRIIGFSSARPENGEKPLRAELTYCTTRLGRNSALAGLKSLNRLEQVLARAELRDVPGSFVEGLMLNDRGDVVCGTMTNVFLVKDGKLVTPLLDEAGVAGVMRETVMEIAREAGIPVSERRMNDSDLGTADGIFLTNALIGILPVAHLDGMPVPQAMLVTDLCAQLAAQFDVRLAR